jgi:hypothetical protein
MPVSAPTPESYITHKDAGFIHLGVKITNGKTVAKLGVYSTRVRTYNLKIFHKTGTGAGDVVASKNISHTGTGWEDVTLDTPYVIPGSGDYYMGYYYNTSNSVSPFDNYINAAAPASNTPRMHPSTDVDITGTGITGLSETTGAAGALRAIFTDDLVTYEDFEVTGIIQKRSGGWVVVEDEEHTSRNLVIESVTSSYIRINYGGKQGKLGGLFAIGEDRYQKVGITGGFSQSPGFADLYISQSGSFLNPTTMDQEYPGNGGAFIIRGSFFEE